MKIQYTITKAEQKRQILAGKNASITQWVTLPDADITAEILDHPLTKITEEGEVTLFLSRGLPTIYCEDQIFAKRTDGIAYNRVSKDFYALAWNDPGGQGDDYFSDSIIDSPATLEKILAEIEAVRRVRQAEADDKTRESLETFQARLDAYNAEHEHALEPTGEPTEPEPENPDPFASYYHIDGLELMLQHGRGKQAKSMVLDFLEAEFAKKMSERGYAMLDIDGLEYVSVAGYEGDVPTDALRELAKLTDIDGSAYVYYEDDDPYIGLDVTIRFADASRVVVVNVYRWDL